jgi:hypothetical protein
MNNNRAFINPPHLSNEKSLKTLVENRTVYNLNHCELNLLKPKSSILVPLKFNDLVVTSMLRGKSNASLMIPVLNTYLEKPLH